MSRVNVLLMLNVVQSQLLVALHGDIGGGVYHYYGAASRIYEMSVFPYLAQRNRVWNSYRLFNRFLTKIPTTTPSRENT